MGTKKSNKLYAAAAALAVTASAVAPGLTADAASKVTVKSVTNPASISHYGGYTFAVKKLSLPKTVKVLLSNKKYENRSVKWGKVSYDKKYIGKYQTISGTVSGTTKKASIKVKLNNYPVDVVEPKLAPVAVGEKLNLPSTIDVKYKDGKVIARSAKSFNLTAEKTDKAGMMKLSYNYMGKNSSIKGSIAYEVKAAEITNVMNEIKDDMLSVSADVKYPAKDAKAEVLVYAFKDMTKEPIKVAAELKDGKLTAKSAVLPAGTHAFAVKVGEVVSPAKDFVIEAPMVKEVKAINLAQVEVKFNKELDKTSAETLANYELKIGSAVAANPTSVELTGKDTALLTFSKKDQSTDAKLTVKNVKTAKNVVIDTVEKDVRFIDVVAPVAGSIEVVAPRVIRVNFSEPLASKPDFKLNNGQTAIVSTDFTPGNDYADLTIGIDPANGSSHTLEVVGGADYAGFKIDSVTKTFVYQTDVVAPMATISKVLDNNSVEIKFDKELNASTLTGNLEIFHTVKGGQGYKATAVTSVKQGTKDTIVVDFPGAVFPEGQVKFFLGYADDKGTLLQDKWGNKFAAAELSAVYAADKEAPTLVSVEGKTKRTIELKLSEEVSADSVVKAGNIVLTDADNKVVAVNASLSDDKKVVTLTSTSDLAGGNYKVVAKDIADASGNKLAEVARTFYVNDMVAPTVTADADLLAGDKKVKIKFSEAMNVASITDKSKYKLADADLDSKVTITAVDGNKAVILDFSATNETTLAGADITVGRVADATGNLTTDFSTLVKVAGQQSTITAKEAQVTGKNTVKVYFDEVITGAVANDFAVTSDEAGTVTNIVNSIEAGKSVLTLTVSQNLPFDASEVTVATKPEVKAKNNDGLFVKFSALEAKDKYAPEITTAVFADNKVADSQDTLTLTFSEALYAPSVQDSDFAVAGRVVEAIEVGANNTVTLKLKADGTVSSAKPASVSIVNTIEDASRNAKSSQVFTDVTTPVVLTP